MKTTTENSFTLVYVNRFGDHASGTAIRYRRIVKRKKRLREEPTQTAKNSISTVCHRKNRTNDIASSKDSGKAYAKGKETFQVMNPKGERNTFKGSKTVACSNDSGLRNKSVCRKNESGGKKIIWRQKNEPLVGLLNKRSLKDLDVEMPASGQNKILTQLFPSYYGVLQTQLSINEESVWTFVPLVPCRLAWTCTLWKMDPELWEAARMEMALVRSS
ncbi:uncharacterized protein LOC122800170 [Protopterus annectens]|uniref:uncharacterized protein LOC122800170 n=1 Tax=Protopterus annectens TaxID=7888 RepID=UPI001CFC1E51|nr:uncharacterized protein LOC122800170 [Protopterus annectens]